MTRTSGGSGGIEAIVEEFRCHWGIQHNHDLGMVIRPDRAGSNAPLNGFEGLYIPDAICGA